MSQNSNGGKDSSTKGKSGQGGRASRYKMKAQKAEPTYSDREFGEIAVPEQISLPKNQPKKPTINTEKAMIIAVDKMFDAFQNLGYDFNKRVHGTDLELSWIRPSLSKEHQSDWQTGSGPIQVFSGRISTRRWTMVVRGTEERVCGYILPADKLITFALNQGQFKPFFSMEPYVAGVDVRWHMNGEDINQEAFSSIYRCLVDYLVRFAGGEQDLPDGLPPEKVGLKAPEEYQAETPRGDFNKPIQYGVPLQGESKAVEEERKQPINPPGPAKSFYERMTKTIDATTAPSPVHGDSLGTGHADTSGRVTPGLDLGLDLGFDEEPEIEIETTDSTRHSNASSGAWHKFNDQEPIHEVRTTNASDLSKSARERAKQFDQAPIKDHHEEDEKEDQLSNLQTWTNNSLPPIPVPASFDTAINEVEESQFIVQDIQIDEVLPEEAMPEPVAHEPVEVPPQENIQGVRLSWVMTPFLQSIDVEMQVLAQRGVQAFAGRDLDAAQIALKLSQELRDLREKALEILKQL